MAPGDTLRHNPDQVVRFSVNGVELLVADDLGKNLNSVIKSETNFKVVPASSSAWHSHGNVPMLTPTVLQGTKIACAEGGCGACAVEVSSYDAATGIVRVISSRLFPNFCSHHCPCSQIKLRLVASTPACAPSDHWMVVL